MAVILEKPGYIYCITNTVNGKKYVGETMYPEARWSQHIRNVNKSKDKVKRHPLVKAIAKYGAEAFTFDIVAEYSSPEEALRHEDEWIEHFQSRIDQHGYNMREGGRGGSVFAETSIAKMREAKLGKKPSEESLAARSVSLKQAWAKRREPFLQQIRELSSLGLKNAEIAKEVGLCAVTVGKCLREMGIDCYIKTEKGKEEWISKISGENHYHANRVAELTPKVIEMRLAGKGSFQLTRS